MIEINPYDNNLKKSATTALKAVAVFFVSLAIINFTIVILFLLMVFGVVIPFI